MFYSPLAMLGVEVLASGIVLVTIGGVLVYVGVCLSALLNGVMMPQAAF